MANLLLEPSSAFFGNSKNLASASCRSTPIGKIAERRKVFGKEPQNCSIPTPRFAKKVSTWNPLFQAEGIFLQNCVMEIPRNQISELHFGKFPDTSGLQCWKNNFKTELRSCSGCLALAVLWIKRSGGGQISGRSNDVAVKYRACIP